MGFPRQVLSALTLIVLVAAAGGIAAAENSPTVVAYRLQTTGNVQLSLPTPSEVSEILYRDVRGQWSTLPVEITDSTLRLRIEVKKIKNGRTMIVLNVPKRVNMDDSEPPKVVRFNVDGHAYGSTRTVALGGIEMAPRRIEIEVKDELNWLRTRSLLVTVNGKRHTLRDAGVAYERISPKHAIITLDMPQLLEGMTSDNTVTLTIDDYALDEDALNCSLSFRYTPPYRLEDGSLIAVDTVTASAGWSQWWVLADGVKMDTSYGTTAGYTWLSDANSQPHWIRLEFPKPRTVSGVALWWAHYETYRTSVAYDVQTWDGEKWVTQVKVKDQAETQRSEHAFPPVTTTAVRVWQPSMSGHPGRAEYMWVSEFEVL